MKENQGLKSPSGWKEKRQTEKLFPWIYGVGVVGEGGWWHLRLTRTSFKSSFQKAWQMPFSGNDGKSLVLTRSKQTLKVFNFRAGPLWTAPTNESAGRNEAGGSEGGWGGGWLKRRKTNMTHEQSSRAFLSKEEISFPPLSALRALCKELIWRQGVSVVRSRPLHCVLRPRAAKLLLVRLSQGSNTSKLTSRSSCSDYCLLSHLWISKCFFFFFCSKEERLDCNGLYVGWNVRAIKSTFFMCASH